jgi:hypothetical protein
MPPSIHISITKDQEEFLLREHDRLKIDASHMRQLEFLELSRWLNKNADAALKLASDENIKKSPKGSR